MLVTSHTCISYQMFFILFLYENPSCTSRGAHIGALTMRSFVSVARKVTCTRPSKGRVQ